MSNTAETFKEAFISFKKILGEGSVFDKAHSQSVYGINEIVVKREIAGALKPKSTEEVCKIMDIAAKLEISLYPISTGNNWGYGAATPVMDGCFVMDLSAMNRILEFDSELGIVTVEPGVTPKMLGDFLKSKNADYLVPVSGAGPNASLIGNALERGYGVTPFVDHFSAVMSLEAVLPDSTVYRSAFGGNGADAIDKTFKWGIGPYLDGIFSQANIGIVTKMTIALAPIPNKVMAFILSLKNDKYLEDAVIGIREILKNVGNLTGSINLMNSRRVLSMVEDYPFDKVSKGEIMSDELVNSLIKKNMLASWTIGGMIYGNNKVLKEAKKAIKHSLKGKIKKSFFFTRKKINFFKALSRLLPDSVGKTLKKQLNNLDEAFNVGEGMPTEMALPLCYWKSGKRKANEPMNPAHDGCGVIWYSPLVVMKPKSVRLYTEMVEMVCRANAIEPLITLTSLSQRCFDSTVPILFDPTDEDETKRAKKCYEELYYEGKKLGFLPYRMGIDHMDFIFEKKSVFWDTVKKIKEKIDPKNIISPGRYCPF